MKEDEGKKRRWRKKGRGRAMTKQDKNMKEDEGKEERKEGRKDDEGR
jgi:hypothetical protein